MEIQIPGLTTPQKPYSIWDNYVPIQTNGRRTDVYLLNPIDSPEEYGELYSKLLEADKGDTFVLHINNGGGYVDTGFMLIDAIQNTKATVIAKLTGTVGSISTIITLACDRVEVPTNLSWLSHNYSGGVQGKGGEIKAQMDFMSRELADSFTRAHDCFFTEAEIQEIINDTDIWLNAEEVKARLDCRKRKDYEALEAVAHARKQKLRK